MVSQIIPADEPPTPGVAGSRRRRIMIVAGEASGDMHGGDLATQILTQAPETEIFGIAGKHMRQAGVQALVRIEDIAGMGAIELASTFGRALRAYSALRAILRHNPPDLLVVIDYAEFNLALAGVAHGAGVPVLYYILPQVWAWRRQRIRKLVARADRLAVVFPFEAELYAAAGKRVSFVGHPLLDMVRPAQDRNATIAGHGLAPGSRILALLPGSRRGEIRYLLRPMLEASRILAADHDITPVVVLAPTLAAADLQAVGGPMLDSVRIIEGDAYSIIAASELALVASGTATLETALLGCPMVIAYKVSALTYGLGRALVSGVDFIGMPNILAGRKIVPELIQWQVTPRGLVRAAEPMLVPSLREEVANALRSLRGKLGMPGAAARVAEMALEMSA